jgi:hypothetical protein
MKGTILIVIVLGALSISGSALRLRMPRMTAPASICRMPGDALGLLATIAPGDARPNTADRHTAEIAQERTFSGYPSLR